MPLPLVVYSLVCAVGALLGLLLAGASIVSIANMQVPWAAWLLVAAFLLPVTFVISGVGVWLAHGRAAPSVVAALVALPWLYGLLFVLAMLRSFEA